MKTVLFIAICTLLLSCSSDPILLSNSNIATLKYKVNGEQQSYSNVQPQTTEYVSLVKQNITTGLIKRYYFTSQKGSSNVFMGAITTDSLNSNSYFYDSLKIKTNGFAVPNILQNGIQSSIRFNGDFINYKITSYQNGLVSGTFTAKFTLLSDFSNYSKKGSVNVTDGEFNNLKVIY